MRQRNYFRTADLRPGSAVVGRPRFRRAPFQRACASRRLGEPRSTAGHGAWTGRRKRAAAVDAGRRASWERSQRLLAWQTRTEDKRLVAECGRGTGSGRACWRRAWRDEESRPVVLAGLAGGVVAREALLHHVVKGASCAHKLVVHGLEFGDLVGVAVDELDDLGTHGEGLLVEFLELLVFCEIVASGVDAAKLVEQPVNVGGLREDSRLHLCLPLELGGRRVGEDLDVVDGEDAGLAANLTPPPVLVDAVQDTNDFAAREGELTGLGGSEVVQGTYAGCTGRRGWRCGGLVRLRGDVGLAWLGMRRGRGRLGRWLLLLLLLNGRAGGGGAGGAGGLGLLRVVGGPSLTAALILDGEFEGPSELFILCSELLRGWLFGRLGSRVFFLDCVLRLEGVVGLLHEAEALVVELACPLLYEGVASLLDGCVGVAIQADACERLCEGATCEFLVCGEAAVFGDGIGESERVELDVCVSMHESLLDSSDAVARSRGEERSKTGVSEGIERLARAAVGGNTHADSPPDETLSHTSRLSSQFSAVSSSEVAFMTMSSKGFLAANILQTTPPHAGPAKSNASSWLSRNYVRKDGLPVDPAQKWFDSSQHAYHHQHHHPAKKKKRSEAVMTATAEAGLSGINLNEIRLSVDDTDAQSDDGSGSFASAASSPRRSIDDDTPPAFPSLNSAQRQSSASTSTALRASAPTKAAAFLQAVAPRNTPSTSNSLMAPPPTSASSRSGGLAAPPSTSALTAPLGVGGASGVQGDAGKKRKKVALAPGSLTHSWVNIDSMIDTAMVGVLTSES
ncbi:hypothetical protein L1887_51934 [Cichorium endivia]|nr:hypothetical protein L1887_51934 [Cichorium endivia]